MGFLCQGPSCRAAFYPNYRLGDKGRRRGLWGFHDQAGRGAPPGSRPRGGRMGMVRAETGVHSPCAARRLNYIYAFA